MKSADAAKVAAAKKAVSKTKARKAMGTTPGTTQ
jgi:hypothetical protein